MRKGIVLGAVLAAVVLPTASRAQLQLGLRVGFGPPLGDVMKYGPMRDVLASQIPIQVDALYEITPALAAGPYVSYGFGQLSSDYARACDSAGAECSMRDVRFGVQGVYAFAKVSRRVVPWAGVGVGYESLTRKVDLGGASLTQDVTGWELLNLQVGGDYRLDSKLAVGPYVMYSIGQYSSIGGASIADKGTHEWLSFGVRGKFDP